MYSTLIPSGLRRVARSRVAVSSKQRSRNYSGRKRKTPDEQTESHFIYHPHDTLSKLMVTCEHASNRIPPPWEHLEEKHLKEMHWAYDIGTEKFALEFAKRTGSPALFARFSRLLIDVNRPLDSDTLIRDKCDNKPVAIGTNVTAEDKQKRIDLYWKPYREAFDRLLAQYTDTEMVLGVHSFTPNYEGSVRTVEIGVLCSHEHIASAERLNTAFKEAGYVSKINEPWTGDICDVMKTGNKKGKVGIVVEFRQDLVVIPKWKAQVEKVLMTTLHEMDLLR